MTKKYYQILGISETATLEEVKKAYRKLAQQWHPDKFATKSLAEKEQANEKMQEINQAYEVLGDEEKKKRYDLGETNFFSSRDTENFEEYYRRREEELEGEIIDTKKRIRLIGEFLLRRDAINEIKYELAINHVHIVNLDHALWAPYETYIDMVYEIEVGDDENDIEFIDRKKVNDFKDRMIVAIRKRGEELKNGINNPQVDRARINAVESIERELRNKGLKFDDLGVEYRNYQEHINSLPKVWQISSYRDKVKEFIRLNSKENIDSKKDDRINNLKEKFFQPPSVNNNDEWNKEKEGLLEEIKELKKKNNEQKELNKKLNGIEELIKELQTEIKELKHEIKELKRESDDNPNTLVYVSKKENDLQIKQSRLDQLTRIVEANSDYKEQNNNNPLPIIPIVIVVSITSLLGLIIYQVKKNKIKK